MLRLKDSYVSSSQAARMLKIHPFTIQRLLRDGRVPAEKLANRWLIPRAFVEEFAKSYVPRRGRPKSKSEYARREDT